MGSTKRGLVREKSQYKWRYFQSSFGALNTVKSIKEFDLKAKSATVIEIDIQSAVTRCVNMDEG